MDFPKRNNIQTQQHPNLLNRLKLQIGKSKTQCKSDRFVFLFNFVYFNRSLILPLEQGLKLWKYFPTKMYKKFSDAQAFMER